MAYLNDIKDIIKKALLSRAYSDSKVEMLNPFIINNNKYQLGLALYKRSLNTTEERSLKLLKKAAKILGISMPYYEDTIFPTPIIPTTYIEFVNTIDSAFEGQTLSVYYRVSNNITNSIKSVNLTYSGIAINPGDYTTDTTNIEIDNSKDSVYKGSFNILVTADMIAESSKSLIITMDTSVNCTVGSNNQITITLTD